MASHRGYPGGYGGDRCESRNQWSAGADWTGFRSSARGKRRLGSWAHRRISAMTSGRLPGHRLNPDPAVGGEPKGEA